MNAGTFLAGLLSVTIATACDGGPADSSNDDPSDDPADDPGDDPSDPSLREPAAPIDIEGDSLAGYDPMLDRVYVAVGPIIEAIDLAQGERAEFFTADADILALDVSREGVAVLSALEGDRARLRRLDHDGEVELELDLPIATSSSWHPIVRQLSAETAVVLTGTGSPGVQASGLQSTVVDMSSQETMSSAEAIYTFLYQQPGIGVLGGRLFVPSAYPGEIAEASVAPGGIDELRRIHVNEDWLHDVAMLGEDRALVAGHIEGVGVVDLIGTTGFEGAPYTPISDLKWAYSIVAAEHAYSTAGDSVLCIDTADLTHWSMTSPGFAPAKPGEGNATAPLGERAPGRVLVHQAGTGIVEIDCEAARP